jgi:outer membrane lipoprotein-sorting protein
MKRLFFLVTGLVAVFVINAQSLDEIVNKYAAAQKVDQLASISTIKITGKVSQMGQVMPITLYMKNPNKVKAVISFGGQEIIQVFDGEKGYMVNPLMGSSDPVELTGDQLKQVQNNNAFSNELIKYFKNGKLTLEGEENVKGKPAYKLKATPEGMDPVYMLIDKESFYLVKTTTKVNQMGTTLNVETYPSDYVDINGVVMPKKTTTSANGMESGDITFDLIEVNVPIDDSVFKIK